MKRTTLGVMMIARIHGPSRRDSCHSRDWERAGADCTSVGAFGRALEAIVVLAATAAWRGIEAAPVFARLAAAVSGRRGEWADRAGSRIRRSDLAVRQIVRLHVGQAAPIATGRE